MTGRHERFPRLIHRRVLLAEVRPVTRALIVLALLASPTLGWLRTAVPAYAAEPTFVEDTQPPTASAPTPDGTYVVQPRDTAFSIARRNGISVDALVWANRLPDANVIREGQKLVIPTINGKLHTVQPEETLAGIASSYGVGPDALLSTNSLAPDAALSSGQRILVPMPLRPLPAVDPTPATGPGSVLGSSATGSAASRSAQAASEPSTASLVAAQVEPSIAIPLPASEGTSTAVPGPLPPLSSMTVGLPPGGPSLVTTAAPVIRLGGTASAPSGPPVVTTTTVRISVAWPITLKPPYIAITTQFSPQHRGIDIGAPTGTPIKAAAAGTVKSAEKLDSAYGWKIVLDHGDGVHTWYAHLSEFAVAEGDRVATGQTIGLVGSSGLSTGPHLHFELRVNNVHVNPLLVLPSP